MAGGAVEVLPVVSPICPVPLYSIHLPPLLLAVCNNLFAEMGATSTASRWLEVNIFLLEKRDGKSYFGIIIQVPAVSGLWRSLIAVRCYIYPCRQSRILGSLSC